MKSMELQKIPGLDFNDLGLVSDVVIPPKLKVPVFAKYDGVSCPKLHLRSYVRKIQPHTVDSLLPRKSVGYTTRVVLPVGKYKSSYLGRFSCCFLQTVSIQC